MQPLQETIQYRGIRSGSRQAETHQRFSRIQVQMQPLPDAVQAGRSLHNSQARTPRHRRQTQMQRVRQTVQEQRVLVGAPSKLPHAPEQVEVRRVRLRNVFQKSIL